MFSSTLQEAPSSQIDQSTCSRGGQPVPSAPQRPVTRCKRKDKVVLGSTTQTSQYGGWLTFPPSLSYLSPMWYSGLGNPRRSHLDLGSDAKRLAYDFCFSVGFLPAVFIQSSVSLTVSHLPRNPTQCEKREPSKAGVASPTVHQLGASSCRRAG